MRALRWLLLFGTLTNGVMVSASAQERADTSRVHELESLVVTAEPVRAAPPPVSTVTADAAEVRRTHTTDPWDLVRRTTGIEVHEQGQGPGFASNAVLRGFSSDHSADVLLVVDGVPINLPIHGHVEGYNDWSVLAAPSVGSLRVLHGPASPLYGDFAFGGVVEVFTPADLDGTGAQLGASTFGDASGWIRNGARTERQGYFAALAGQRQEGWRDNSSFWLGHGALRGWSRAGSGRLEGGLLLYGSAWDSPGFVSVTRYNADDLEPAVDTSDGGNAQRAIATGRYSAALRPGLGLEVNGWLQGVRTHVFLNIPDDGTQQQQEELDRRVAFGSQAKVVWDLPSGDFTLGVSGRLDVSKYDRYFTVQRSRGEAETLNDGRYLSGTAFARWRNLVTSRLALDLGARVDVVNYGSRDLQQGRDAPMDWATSVQLGPKLGARYILSGSTSLFASVSRGFRGAPGVVTDPNLPPLGVWAEEVGVQVTTEDLQAEAALFRMDVTNERIQDPVTLAVVNSGASYRQGVWGRVAWRALARLTLEADATFNDARIKGEAEEPAIASLAVSDEPVLHPVFKFHLEPPLPGDPVPGIARYNARVGADYRIGANGRLGARVRLGGPFTPLGEPDVRTKGYALLELNGTVPLGGKAPVVDVSLQNALDTRYPEIRSAGFINPGSPRVLRVSLRYEN